MRAMGMKVKLFLLTSISAIFCFVFAVFAETEYENLKKYRGTELKSKTLICKSNRVASAGYWRNFDDKTMDVGASISTESKTSTWRITLKEHAAEVIRHSGATQMIEQPEIYSLEPTVSGLLLVWRDRALGESPQIITIDISNSSFVYSTQHVNPFSNRSNIFYGTCQPYP